MLGHRVLSTQASYTEDTAEKPCLFVEELVEGVVGGLVGEKQSIVDGPGRTELFLDIAPALALAAAAAPLLQEALLRPGERAAHAATKHISTPAGALRVITR